MGSTARKLIIAGPGRSGTTLLVRLFDGLGLHTGAQRLKYFEDARAGLETGLLGKAAPYVVKDPRLSTRLRRHLAAGEILAEQIDHVVVPIRDLDSAAASRFRRSVESKSRHPGGGLWMATSRRAQRRVLGVVVYELVWTLAEFEIPHTLLAFPRFATDASYAFRRLSPLLPGISKEEFERVWRDVTDGQLISSRQALRVSLREHAAWLLEVRVRHPIKRALLRLRRFVSRRGRRGSAKLK